MCRNCESSQICPCCGEYFDEEGYEVAAYNEPICRSCYEYECNTDDLTDDSSEDFEKWLYILTACSFSFLLLIFTIIGCFNSKRTNSELKEMLKTHIK